MKSQAPQSIRSSNPFSSDDDISDDDEKQQDYIQTTKPYEEHFEKFSQQFNNYIQKTKDLDQKYQIPLGDAPFNILHLNVNQQVQKQGLFDVNQTDNPFYDKVSATFTYLDTEIGKITEVFENKILNVISMYGERALDDFQDEEEFPLLEGQAEFEMSKLSPIFKQSLDLIKKIMGILYNLINQLNIIYYKKNDLHKNIFKNVELNSVFQTIGKGLSVVYVLDCAINQNKKIRDHWNVYKRMIKIIQTEPSKFGSDPKTVKRFEKNIARLDKTVLSGACVQAVLEQNYDANKSFTSDQLKQQNLCLLAKNKDLIELFENYFKQQIVFYNDILDTTSEVQERKDLLYFLCTYAFFRKIFPEEQDKKIYKSLWTLQKKSPVLEGHTHIFCYVYKFLKYVCPLNKSTTLDPKEPDSFTKLYVQDLDIQIPKKINTFYEDFCYWISRMESILTSNTALATGDKSKRDRSIKIVEEYTSYRVRLLIKALQMASQIKQMITTNLMLHINEGIGFTPQLIKHVVKGIVMLKAIESVYLSKIEAFQPHMLLKTLIKQLLMILGATYEKLTKADYKQKKPLYNEFRAAIQNVLKNLRGPITSLKISTMEFALNFIISNYITEKKEGQDIKFIFWKIKIISQFHYNISKATNCSFLFWCKDILPLAIKQFFENPSQSKRLIYLSQAISDTLPIVKATLHLQNPLYMYETFKEEVITTFKDEYLIPLTRQIEDFLRIQIHAMLIDKVIGKNPFKDEINNIKKLLELEQIQFFDVIIDIKREIQNQLNEKFYNLNVLNMHDMETYEQMRVLAKFYFDINLINVYIPSQTIEQGQLDILQILRNIPTFVDTYTYNLHNQTFTQITTESKLVQTIGIQQISDSIRTHGLGILNTTVNSIFKYVARKIEVLSNLLYDELILQNLIREEKWFQENKIQIDGYYPYERAKKLSSTLKKLGVSKEGNTYLDQFRIFITQIGNALGFIRLLRSASLNYCSKSIEFLPYQIDSEDSFLELAKQAMSGQATTKAATELDDILLQLKSYFSSGTDYLKRIVSTMSQYAQSESQKHFTNFHILVPCLTLNYVTHVLICKEKIPIKNNLNAFLCNDGFIIGIAYILKLYNLEEKFHLIHWQEEVRKVYKEELEQIKDISQANTTQISTHRLQEMTLQNDLSIKKLESNLFEYNMFFNTFQACKILFREDPV